MSSVVSHQPSPGTRKRYRSVAVLLALFVSPAISMLYLGRGLRALCYLLLTIAVIGLMFPLAAAGYWPEGIGWWAAAFLVALVGAVDSFRIAGQYRQEFSGPWYSRWYGIVGVYIAAAALVVGVRAFIIEPYRIPSGTMLPTLQVGDYILVNKYIYGIRLPVVRTLLVQVGKPQRGDVMVFRYPVDPRINYIKRVVGIPGDRIGYRGKRLYVNGAALYTIEVDYRYKYVDGQGNLMTATRLSERLDRSDHEILIDPEVPPIHLSAVRKFSYKDHCEYSRQGFDCTVPEGHYLTLGDNRDNSSDSRYWGFVPEANIVGKAFMVWWNDQTPDRTGTSLR